jgi:hypothetical protein
MALNDQQKAEITQQLNETYQTKRATVPALEEILFDPIPLCARYRLYGRRQRHCTGCTGFLW